MSVACLNVSENATDDILSNDEMDLVVEIITFTTERMYNRQFTVLDRYDFFFYRSESGKKFKKYQEELKQWGLDVVERKKKQYHGE